MRSTLDEVWIAHDIGRALNPLLVEGQVEGSVYMGIGEALMEEQVFRKGLHKIPSMLEYKSPTTLETPEIHTILVETDDPEGPFGAKEAGQGPLLPVIPAIANAVYDAVGVRIDEVPITPGEDPQGARPASAGQARPRRARAAARCSRSQEPLRRRVGPSAWTRRGASPVAPVRRPGRIGPGHDAAAAVHVPGAAHGRRGGAR